MSRLFEYADGGQGQDLFQYEEDKPLFEYEEPRDVQLMDERRGSIVASEEQPEPAYQKPASLTRAENAFRWADNASMPTHEEDVAKKERAFKVADNASMRGMIRNDGKTYKGAGFLGPLQTADGRVMTEFSIGVDFGDGEMEIPAVVPTLTQEELDHLLDGGDVTPEIDRKARDHAWMRLKHGKSVFAERGEVYPLPKDLVPDYGDYKFVQGDEPSPWDKFRGVFTDTDAGSSRDAMAVSLSNETGMAPSEVLDHFDEVSRSVAKELGVKTQLSPEEYYNMIVAAGGMAALAPTATSGSALWGIAKSVGIFTGIDLAKKAGVQLYSGDPRDHYIADLMSPETSPKFKGFMKGVETAFAMLVAGGVSHPKQTLKFSKSAGQKLKKVFADISKTTHYKYATARERFGMVSDVGLLIDAMKASGKSEGQILRQIRRKYGSGSKIAKEAWEELAVRTGRVPNYPKQNSQSAESKPANSPIEGKPQTADAKTEETRPIMPVENPPIEQPAAKTSGVKKAVGEKPTVAKKATVDNLTKTSILKNESGEQINGRTKEPGLDLGPENDGGFFRRIQEAPDKITRLKIFEEEVRRLSETDTPGIYDINKVDDATLTFSGIPVEEQQPIFDMLDAETRALEHEILKAESGLTADDVDNPVVSYAYNAIDAKSLRKDYPGAYNSLRKKFGPNFFKSAQNGGQSYDAVQQELRDRGLLNDTDDMIDVLIGSRGIKDNRVEHGVNPHLRGKKTYGFADSGKYADMPPKGSPSPESMAKAAKKESVAGAGTGAVYKGKTDFEPMELPELVHLHRLLTDGKLPRVMKRMEANGIYNSKTKTISLNGEKFKDPQKAAKVLAHELGHYVDDLELDMPGIPRGSILGRIIAAHKPYRKHFVEGFPGGPHPLTPNEKASLRRQVKRELKGGERYVDEIITKKLNVTPDDVLSIWNSTMTPKVIKKEFPGLYNYVAKLDTNGKKALIVAAMRGDLPESVQKFARTITEKTGKKIKQVVEGTPEQVRVEFRKAVMAEVLARRLLDRNVVMDELKQFTGKWKPFDPNANWKDTQYRYKPAELYADAFSALLTDPNRLAEEAPTFFNAFLNFMERKPKFAEAWSDIQREIRGGKSVSARRHRARESMRIKTAEVLAKAEPPSDGFWEDLSIKMVDKAWRILKDVHAVGEIPIESNPYISYENWLYSGTTKEGYQTDMMEMVFKPLADASIDPVTFGEYLRYRREVGERHSMANPGGETQGAAYEMLKEVVKEAGPAIEKAADAFWKVRKEWFIDRIKSSEMYSKELTDKIIGNEIYARFEVVKEETIAKYGESFSGMIHGQVGTLQDIADPFLATVASDVSSMSTLFKMRAMRDTVKFYQKNYPDKIHPAKRTGGNRFAEPTRNSGYGMIGYLENGKAKAFYVPKNVSRAFETRERNPAVMFFYNLTLPFRKLFVDYNLAFALKNPVRDVVSAVKVLPGSSLRSFLPYWFKSFPEAYGRARGRAMSPAVRMMLHEGSLIANHEFRGRVSTNGTTEFLQKMFKTYDLSPDGNGVWSHIRKNRGARIAVRPLVMALQELSYFTQATEGMTKIASHKWLLKNHPNMPKELRAHIVRESGSPRFMVKGELNTALEALIPFYNPAKEGTRTQLRAARRNKRDYWQKTFVYNLGPRILMRLAKLGLLGGAMAAIMNRATEYDTSNYNVIPLGMEGNKAVYFRVPQDEFARLLLNVEDLAWRTATQGAKNPTELLKIYSGMIDVTFSNAPGMNPAISLLGDTLEFISGGIPYDDFRSKKWFTEDVNRSQKRRWEAFAKGAASRYGLKAYYDFEKQDAKTVTDKIGKLPVLGPAFNSFVKKTDFGLSQAAEREWEKVEAMKGEDRMLVKDVFERWLTNDARAMSDEEKLAIIRRFSSKSLNITEEYYKAWMNRNGNSLERRLVNAKSKVEQMYYKSLMARDPFYKPTDMTSFFESVNKEKK